MVGRVRVVPYGPGLDALERHVRDAVVQPVAKAVAEDMRRYVPVLTGDLRRTIRVEILGLEARVWFGDVSSGVDYHLYQEYGTSKMAAQPYARPALFTTRAVG